jgi:hypothetical protein
MITPKDKALLSFLGKETANGNLKWRATAQDNQFTVSLRGKYNVMLLKQGPLVALYLFDVNDRELLQVNQLDDRAVEEIYEYVRRKALDVDGAIDEILKGETAEGRTSAKL